MNWKHHTIKFVVLAAGIFAIMAASASNLSGDEVWKSLLNAIVAHIATELRGLSKE